MAGCKNSGVLFDLCPSLGGPAWIRPTRSDSLSAHISVAASFLLHILGEAGYSWGTIWPYVVSRSLRLWAIIWPHKGALWVPCELETKVTKALQLSSTLSHSPSLSLWYSVNLTIAPKPLWQHRRELQKYVGSWRYIPRSSCVRALGTNTRISIVWDTNIVWYSKASGVYAVLQRQALVAGKIAQTYTQRSPTQRGTRAAFLHRARWMFYCTPFLLRASLRFVLRVDWSTPRTETELPGSWWSDLFWSW